MKVKVFHIRLSNEYLLTDQEHLNNFLSSVTVKKTATELLTGQPDCWSILVFYEYPKAEKSATKSDKISVTGDTDLTSEEKKVFLTLKQWRQDKAIELDIPVYIICNNIELMTIAKVNPQTIEELSKIKGFRDGGLKIAKYGEDIITVLNSI